MLYSGCNRGFLVPHCIFDYSLKVANAILCTRTMNNTNSL